MLTLDNITVQYGDHKVIDELSLIMDSEKVHGLIGLNGAGKTTLLNTIYGFTQAKSGDIKHNNEPLHRKQIAFLETINYFYPNITGREYLNLFPEPNSGFDLVSWNNLFELPLDHIIDGYSTGMKKKLALLGILKLDKSIYILDEPFNGLDLESGQILKLIVARLKEKQKTVIITSHILETLFSCCDYIHYLNKGKIKQSYSKEDFTFIEKEIFGLFEQDKQQLISKLM